MGYLSWSTPTAAVAADPCYITAVCPRGHPLAACRICSLCSKNITSTGTCSSGSARGIRARAKQLALRREGGRPEALYRLKSTIGQAAVSEWKCTKRRLDLCGSALALGAVRRKVPRMGERCLTAISHRLRKTEATRFKSKSHLVKRKNGKPV